jgi:hypothetical protein
VAEAKRLAIATLRTASAAYGDAVRDEQEVLAHAANIVIEVYAIESAIGRAEKLSKAGSERGSLAQDIVRVYASDAADRIAHAGKQIVNAISAKSTRLEPVTSALGTIAEHRGTDTIAARRRIGNAAIEAGRYPF